MKHHIIEAKLGNKKHLIVYMIFIGKVFMDTC